MDTGYRMYRYQAYGLSILSDLIFPEFMEMSRSNLPFQENVIIRLASVSIEGLPQCEEAGFCHQLNRDTYWLNIPFVGRYLIESGRYITIEPIDGVDEDSVRAFILEPCMGILLMQRDGFVLHGNAIKINDQSIIFLGSYGVGKSSLATVFLQQGHSILTDGICSVTPKLEVIPAYPSMSLWFDTATYFNINTQPLRKIRPKIDRFTLPIDNNFDTKNTVVRSIFILDVHKKNDFSATPLVGGHKIKYLQKNIYKKTHIPILQKDALYFKSCANLANNVPMVLIHRPVTHFRIHELADFIQATGYF